MAAFTDALRKHFEDNELPVHPVGHNFDDQLRHPSGDRNRIPELAFTYHGDEDHRSVRYGLVQDAIDHVLKNGKIDHAMRTGGSPGTTAKKDEDGEDDGHTPLNRYKEEEGGGRSTDRYEMENGDTFHVHHDTFRVGGNDKLGLKGTFRHNVRVDHLYGPG